MQSRDVLRRLYKFSSWESSREAISHLCWSGNYNEDNGFSFSGVRSMQESAVERSSSSQESIQDARRRIFGDVPSSRIKDGREVLARKLQGQEISSWYFLPPTEQPGLHNEEHEYVIQRSRNRRKKSDVKEETGQKVKSKKKK